jgi:hypothetical protein
MKKEERENSAIKNENAKTIYRDKTGKVIDPSETKEAKVKELERMNYKNVKIKSKFLKLK